MSRLWAFPAPDAKVTELGGTDLSNYVGAIDLLIQHLASQTRIPAQYFLTTGGLANMSADAPGSHRIGLHEQGRAQAARLHARVA